MSAHPPSVENTPLTAKIPPKRLWLSLLAALLVVGLLAVSYLSPLMLTDATQLAQANELLRHPLPLPSYVHDVRPAPGQIGPYAPSICVGLYVGPPLTTDASPSSETYVWDNIQFSIDNQPVKVPSDKGSWRMAFFREDEQGKLIVLGGPAGDCYDPRLGLGTHLAAFEIKSMAGQTYSYRWAFQITSFDPTESFRAEQATQNAISVRLTLERTFAAQTQTACAMNLCPPTPTSFLR